MKSLHATLKSITQRYKINTYEPLKGGTSAYVAKVTFQDQSQAILKIPSIQKDEDVDFKQEIRTLQWFNGQGYVKVLTYDEELDIVFLELLGQPLANLNWSIEMQIKLICETLQKSWKPIELTTGFPAIEETVNWFTNYITTTWRKLHHPCDMDVIQTALDFLKTRQEYFDENRVVLVHGDAHNFNLLQTLDGQDFKFIDPDGIIAEPEYDLGVLMREWIADIAKNPIQKGKERLMLLVNLTGLDKIAIWQWGFIQCVATGLVCLENGASKEGELLLNVATVWQKVSPSEL